MIKKSQFEIILEAVKNAKDNKYLSPEEQKEAAKIDIYNISKFHPFREVYNTELRMIKSRNQGKISETEKKNAKIDVVNFHMRENELTKGVLQHLIFKRTRDGITTSFYKNR